MQINGSTKVLGLFGKPVTHSFSPVMHNAAIEYLSLNYAYLPFHIEDDIKSAVHAIKSLNFRGVNVTVPYKESVIPFLDDLTSEAKSIGAVNTIINNQGRLIGDNTDGRGFIRSLKAGLNFDVKGKTILILGAGGAARAIAVSLAFANAKKIIITDLKQAKAKSIAILDDKIEAIKASVSGDVVRSVNLVVNATPVGMEDNNTPIDLGLLVKSNIVYDIVYNRKTSLFNYCQSKEIKVMNGLMMLLYQGVLAFEAWTGEKAPALIMKKVLIEQLK
ncbi:MAG: shikimate dehydrogenase [bacterium]|nr:shikimate dehydrogenase [bacterium]